MIGGTVFAMEARRPGGAIDLNVGLNRYGEPLVLPPRLERLDTLEERDLFARIRVLQNSDCYNLPPQNKQGEYEELVRDNLEQALNRSHRREIVDAELSEVVVLEIKGRLQNKLLLLMRNERNLPEVLRRSPYYRPLEIVDRCIRREAYAFVEDRAEQVGSLQDPLQRSLLTANLTFFLNEITQNGRNSQIYREFYSCFTGFPPAS